MTVSGPLAGILVVDLTRVLAGPYCTMVLSDLGARVVKVEQPGRGDDSRAYGPFIAGQSGYFAAMNRGKESIALDLKAPADRAILERLLEKADVLVENFRPGTMERLGLGWDDLHRRYPRLIYAAASGFGHTGPYSARPAYDMVAQAMGGVMSITGHPGGPPTRVGSSIGDLTAGLFCAIGIASALAHRERHGVATKIDVAMLDSQVAILENAITRYVATGEAPGPLGARHPSIAPFAAFATADGHVVIACGTDAIWQRMCRTIGCPELAADARFTSNDLRARNIEALNVAMEKVLTTATTAEWLRRLSDAEIPHAPINNVADVLADPQVIARNMVVAVDDPDLPTLRVAGNPIKMSEFPDPTTRGRVPKLDQDRTQILADLDNGTL